MSENDDTKIIRFDSGKKKVEDESKRASGFQIHDSPSVRPKIATFKDLEKAAGDLVARWQPLLRQHEALALKLRDLEPLVEGVHEAFNRCVRGALRVMGCRTFGEFCERQLHRSYKQVMAMLHGYDKKRKERRKPTNAEKEHELSKDDIARMGAACERFDRYFTAEDRGDKQEMAKLKNELKVLMEPHRSYTPLSGATEEVLELKIRVSKLGTKMERIAKAALKVVTEIGKVDEFQGLPADLVAAANLLRRELLDLDSVWLGDQPENVN